MGFQEAINSILQPIVINGKEYRPGVTSDANGVRQDFDAPRPGRNHGGVDINYRDENGNPAPINTTNPDVSSPVSGKVVNSKTDMERWGRIIIEDAYGNRHEIMHLHEVNVNPGDTITAGQVIGEMGGRGPSGPNQFAPHVDYKIKRPGNDTRYIDPENYWDDTYRMIFLNYEGLDQFRQFFTTAATKSPG